MGSIRQLPRDLVERIAAGEVVERPAAVLKELVENALDAGATRVQTQVRGAGLELLQVFDDGCGMDREDARLSVLRHATSKLRDAADLERVLTLGFRGEALASIAAVSRLELVTRRSGAPTGWRMVVEGGEGPEPEEVGCPEGTSVTVRDLFFNTPARRKFLKSPGAEQAQLTEVLGRLALSHPEVAFSLRREGTVLLRTPGSGDPLPVLRELVGAQTADALLPVEKEAGDLRVHGFAGLATVHRGARTGEYLFLNGRVFQDVALRYHLEAAYRGLLADRRFPVLAVFLELPPEEVDVNVHPAKAEVRFRDVRRVGAFLEQAVREALGRSSMAPGWSAPAPTAGAPARQDPLRGAEEAAAYQGELPLPRPAVQPSPRHDFARWRLIGQFHRTYLLAEDDDDLFLVDQHAAHERIWYERLSVARAEVAVQELLVPLSLPVTPRERLGFEANRELLEAEGFRVEPFGTDTLLLRAVPGELEETGEEGVFRDLLEHLAAAEAGEGPSERRDRLARRLAACKAAVKANRELSAAEARALFTELSRTMQPYTCPHGRPTVISLSAQEIARRFGR
ncbi:MAG: DNA mismatch repair endonuclease MutL [Thermaerobacter sp.]|jgi:DNA mismatch repair protein MutL|nr:DNA mismatch repair endonuclease MutL [Thermaerobacter sp.]